MPTQSMNGRMRPTTVTTHVPDNLLSLEHLPSYMVRRKSPDPRLTAHCATGTRAHLTNSRLALRNPCAPGRNLLTCPDFTSAQPRGQAAMPYSRVSGAPCMLRRQCPRCHDKSKSKGVVLGPRDLRYTRMMVITGVGSRVGFGPGKRDIGIDIPLARGGAERISCCGLM